METPQFVETYDEPFHRRLFENDHARFYDVLIPAGTSSLYHRHAEDTMYVSIGSSRPQEQTLGAPPGEVTDLPSGIGLCRGHRDEPLVHRVRNPGATDMRMIGVEVKSSPEIVREAPLEHECLRVVWEHARLRGYRLTLEPGAVLQLADVNCSFATVCVSGGCLEIGQSLHSATVSMQPGDALWLGAVERLNLRNCGEQRLVAIMGEWR